MNDTRPLVCAKTLLPAPAKLVRAEVKNE